jgi:hypothetical protein
MTMKDDYYFYLKTTTHGLITCTTEFHIEICEILTPDATEYDFFYMLGSFEGSTTIAIPPFFSTVETTECYFQNFAIQTYDSSQDSYSEVSYSNNIVIDFTSNRKLDITTLSPFSNFTSPYVLYAKMEDRFNNLARKSFTILVCGGETVIP